MNRRWALPALLLAASAAATAAGAGTTAVTGLPGGAQSGRFLHLASGDATLETLGGPDWHVGRIGGAALPEGAEVVFALKADGRIVGRSGCNRFAGSVAAVGDALAFGPFVTTRMACPAALMALEADFLRHLGSVTGYALTPDGSLHLLAGDRIVIAATR